MFVSGRRMFMALLAVLMRDSSVFLGLFVLALIMVMGGLMVVVGGGVMVGGSLMVMLARRMLSHLCFLPLSFSIRRSFDLLRRLNMSHL
jgi:hypothetical protein